MSRNGKTLELPGFYWDEERNRYFPISSRPQQQTPVKRKHEESNAPSRATLNVSGKPRNRRTQIKTVAGLRAIQSGALGTSRNAQVHGALCADRLFNNAYHAYPVKIYDTIGRSVVKTFDLISCDTERHLFVGDDSGRVLTDTHDLDTKASKFHMFGPLNWPDTIAEMSEEVNYVLASEDRFIALALDLTVEVVTGKIRSQVLQRVDYPKRLFGDVYSAYLTSNSLALGSSRKVTVIENFDVAGFNNFRFFNTKSNVLSVHESKYNKNMLLAGGRNGAVNLFDTRAPQKGRTPDLLGSRFVKKGQSSVVHLHVVRNWELLVSTIAGDLEAFDMRFCDHGVPIKIFQGHYNSYTSKLGITVDPGEEYVFAAGQDRRIRGWSIDTGCPLFDDSDEAKPATPLASPVSLDKVQFEEAPSVLKVTEEPSGLRLWANDKHEIVNFTLGYPPALSNEP